MQYRRIPFASGLSPSELLNGRIRTKIDTLVPSIPHLLQGRQSRQASKHSNAKDSKVVSKVEHHYSLGDPCYALYFGPRRDRDPRWVPAIVTKVHGTRSVNVRVIPRGPTWRRHLDQLRPRYGSDQDDDPCEIPTSVLLSTETLPARTDHASSSSSMNQRNNPRLPTGDEYFCEYILLLFNKPVYSCKDTTNSLFRKFVHSSMRSFTLPWLNFF